MRTIFCLFLVVSTLLTGCGKGESSDNPVPVVTPLEGHWISDCVKYSSSFGLVSGTKELFIRGNELNSFTRVYAANTCDVLVTRINDPEQTFVINGEMTDDGVAVQKINVTTLDNNDKYYGIFLLKDDNTLYLWKNKILEADVDGLQRFSKIDYDITYHKRIE